MCRAPSPQTQLLLNEGPPSGEASNHGSGLNLESQSRTPGSEHMAASGGEAQLTPAFLTPPEVLSLPHRAQTLWPGSLVCTLAVPLTDHATFVSWCLGSSSEMLGGSKESLHVDHV